MKWLPTSLLGRNLLLLIALILAGQILSAIVLREMVQKPSLVRLSAILANNLLAVEAGLRDMPVGTRQKFVADFNRTASQLQQTSASPLPFRAQRLLMSEVSKRLGNTQGELIWRQEAGDAFFVRLNIDGQNYWLATAGMQSDMRLPGAGVFSWLLGMVLAIIGAYLIQRRINKPLNTLALAAKQLGQGEAALWLPETGPREIATVCKSFNLMQRQLQEQDKQRALMLAGVSHDLRTPLTKIRIAAELLADEVEADAGEDNPEPATAYRQTIARSCGDIENIIRQFVDFAGIGNSETPAAVDINQLLLELEKAQPQRFTLHLQPLPPLNLRPQAIQRLFLNLLENAQRYGKPEFSIYSRREGAHVVVGICDQGAGIPPAQVAEMLKPFTRGSAARHGLSGSGLGLAIAQRIAKLEGGQLALLPAAGGGLEAQVRLPV